MHEFCYLLKDGSPNEVELVIFQYQSLGWEFVSADIPEGELPKSLTFRWNQNSAAPHPPIYYP